MSGKSPGGLDERELEKCDELYEQHRQRHQVGSIVFDKQDTNRTNGPLKDLFDDINHPRHYTSHPSGIECIHITEHMNFCLGNAIKYIWRAGSKGDELRDLKKARWYIEREIARISKDNKRA